MKRILVFTCKFIISGILAMLILSAFALIYHNPPVAVPQPDKYTNSKYEPNSFWTYMSEGFGFGMTNNAGYIDQNDYDPSVPVIAVLGSSHTQAIEVPQSKNFVSQLQTKLYGDDISDNDIQCLNLGVSGHSFNICASNFEYLPESLPNAKHVIIEAVDVRYSPDQLEKILNGEYHLDMKERGTLYQIAQNIPYFRLIYKKYQDIQVAKANTDSEPAEIDYEAYELGMSKVLQKLSGIAKENGIQLTILYHNNIHINDRSASRKNDPKLVELFRQICEMNDIGFIDVTDAFIEHFNETYDIPYGFHNTTPGYGHLNKLGHSIIASELYNYITEQAEVK